MKETEIVQALRCCAEGECKDCAMHEDKQRCQENLLDKAAEAIERLTQTMQAGFVPYAMLFRGEDGKYDSEWRRFQREWCRPIITGKKFNEFWKETT